MTNLDLTLFETNNCRTLGILDSSVYDVATPDAKITVWIPGGTSVELTFQPKKVNILNSNTLGMSSVTDPDSLLVLPDGIYKVKYTFKPVATYTLEKTFLRACKLQCRFQTALLKLDIFDCNDSTRKAKLAKLKEIEFMIMGAIAAANTNNSSLATDLYLRADSELNKLNIKSC
jgi:hypothetical protein